ncbi:hypothetical protein [Bacillus sp. ISL-18]|nr:hypothetical protein [Bacillus sp. ISL-18]
MIEDVQAAVKHQAKRTVTGAEWVKKEQNGLFDNQTIHFFCY